MGVSDFRNFYAALATAIMGLVPVSAATQEAPIQISAPGDPIGAAAFEVLEKHCSRCHQAGRLVERLKPAKNFGNILKLDEIGADPNYIVPGNPDGSKIIQMILNNEMPFDGAEVPEDDLLALRSWVIQLGEVTLAARARRDFVSTDDMVAAMAADLNGLNRTRIADTRYITLTHLYNAGVPDDAMEVYRQGTVKLLNSLSRVSDALRLKTIDEAGTIIRFNLRDVGWEPSDWNTLLAVYPYAAHPNSRMFDLLTGATLTPLPFVRGDWFAFTASQPPLYDRLLRLPEDFDELQEQFGISVEANINSFKVKRAGFQNSGVSQNNRLIERHAVDTGYFWTSYDFAGNRDRQSLFEFPLGPVEGDFSFSHDGGETIFSLPNGFQGYFLNTADGKKIDKGPTAIVRDQSRRDSAVTNGISCMGCHVQGIRKAKDDIRAHVTADRTFPKAVRDAVEALYPTHDEMDDVLERDATRFRNAMVTAQLDPSLILNGVELINALAKRYEDDVALDLAAAEFGQDTETFLSSLEGAAVAAAIRLKRRLEQGTIPRDTYEEQYIELVERVSDQAVIDLAFLKDQAIEVATVERPIEVSRTFDLALVSDRSDYHVNDRPVFTVNSAEECYLTLINVDGRGDASVIFPNKFQQDNFLPANRDLNFPTAEATFQFRFADPGTETVIATCSLQDRPVDSVEPDFAKMFTDLGNYEALVAKTRTIRVEPREELLSREGVLARTGIKMEVR